MLGHACPSLLSINMQLYQFLQLFCIFRDVITCRHGAAVSVFCLFEVDGCVHTQGNYLEAECVDVDPVGKTITCQYSKPFKGQSDAYTGRQFNVPYDVLVVAVRLSPFWLLSC